MRFLTILSRSSRCIETAVNNILDFQLSPILNNNNNNKKKKKKVTVNITKEDETMLNQKMKRFQASELNKK